MLLLLGERGLFMPALLLRADALGALAEADLLLLERDGADLLAGADLFTALLFIIIT